MTKVQLTQLKMKKMSLRESSKECLHQKDILKFCNNIISAHRTGAFGGKPALWEFLKDVGQNLNREKHGHRYSKTTRALTQAIQLYGGSRVTNFMTLNLTGQSSSSIRREMNKGVIFIAGEHESIFKSVASIYKNAKKALQIETDIPVILAEDETRVKSMIRWDAKKDTLVGFCGNENSHTCISGFEIVVGDEEMGYNKIANAFRECCKGKYARIIMVNPLHEKLPQLLLACSVTCNRFKANWVREQWERIEVLWNNHVKDNLLLVMLTFLI